MKLLLTIVFLSIHTWLFAQSQATTPNKEKQGTFYFYWGWNRAWYTDSTIEFQGENYAFTLEKVAATDRQSPFSIDAYLNPKRITIPQYNVRIGYFVSDQYSVSIGTDHMKYVVTQGQSVPISGRIEEMDSVYEGVYSDAEIVIQKGFLELEHTDGLNYPNVEFRRHDEIWTYRFLSLHLNEGIGIGILLPKTNATLLNKARHDAFHLSGFGVSGVVSGQLFIGRHFFIQSELKAGYIHMPNIRTTNNTLDQAKQRFGFLQNNILFGANWRFYERD